MIVSRHQRVSRRRLGRAGARRRARRRRRGRAVPPHQALSRDSRSQAIQACLEMAAPTAARRRSRRRVAHPARASVREGAVRAAASAGRRSSAIAPRTRRVGGIAGDGGARRSGSRTAPSVAAGCTGSSIIPRTWPARSSCRRSRRRRSARSTASATSSARPGRVGRGTIAHVLGPHVLSALARPALPGRSRSTSGSSSYGDEFKVMGLAPYGEPEFVDEMRQLFGCCPAGASSWTSRTSATGPTAPA